MTTGETNPYFPATYKLRLYPCSMTANVHSVTCTRGRGRPGEESDAWDRGPTDRGYPTVEDAESVARKKGYEPQHPHCCFIRPDSGGLSERAS